MKLHNVYQNLVRKYNQLQKLRTIIRNLQLEIVGIRERPARIQQRKKLRILNNRLTDLERDFNTTMLNFVPRSRHYQYLTVYDATDVHLLAYLYREQGFQRLLFFAPASSLSVNKFLTLKDKFEEQLGVIIPEKTRLYAIGVMNGAIFCRNAAHNECVEHSFWRRHPAH